VADAEKLSIGLVGCGGMGKMLADAFHTTGEARVAAVCDPAGPARGNAAELYRARAFADHEDMLACGGVEAVVVAGPNYLHKDLTIAAARAGKHIFCEKPMALSVADCDRMIQAAESAGVKLMVGQVLRLMFPFTHFKELASEEGLGFPACVDITRLGGCPRSGWRARRDMSGGFLFEVSVHELDLMRHLCGEVKQVSAYGGRFVRREIDYPDVYEVNLLFRSGAVGHLHAGGASAVERYEGMVICPGGTLTFGPEWATALLYRDDSAEPVSIEHDEAATPEGVDREVASFVGWVLRDEPPVVTAWDGRAAVELAQAASMSIDQGKPVDLPLSVSTK